MRQIFCPTIRNRIHLQLKLFAVSAEKFSIGKAGRVVWRDVQDLAVLPEWKKKAKGEDLLAKFRAVDFMELTEHAQPIQELDIDLMLGTLAHIQVYESGMVVTVFLDGTEIEYYTEQKEKKDI